MTNTASSTYSHHQTCYHCPGVLIHYLTCCMIGFPSLPAVGTCVLILLFFLISLASSTEAGIYQACKKSLRGKKEKRNTARNNRTLNLKSRIPSQASSLDLNVVLVRCNIVTCTFNSSAPKENSPSCFLNHYPFPTSLYWTSGHSARGLIWWMQTLFQRPTSPLISCKILFQLFSGVSCLKNYLFIGHAWSQLQHAGSSVFVAVHGVFCFCFLFQLLHAGSLVMAWRIQFPDQGLNPGPLHRGSTESQPLDHQQCPHVKFQGCVSMN